MINIIICEDNNIQRKRIKDIIDDVLIKEDLDMKVALQTGSVEEVLEYAKNNKSISIYFFDVDLKNSINGIELADRIRNVDIYSFIIFITVHPELSYLTFKYKVEAFDYITKDNCKKLNDRIKDCLLKVNKRCTKKNIGLENTFTIKRGNNIINLNYSDILFFETTTTSHKIRVHCIDKYLEFYGKLKDIEKKLDDGFFRCHKAYIVNVNNIKEIDKKQKIVYMKDGSMCYTSIRYVKFLLNKFLS